MSDRPNVLWIMSDQHNAKCTSWGDHPTDVQTPNLERLSNEGTRFSRAVTQNPICTPSRTSFLTGQYPLNHGFYGLTERGHEEPSPGPDLFEMCQSFGYRTAAVGKIHTPTGLIEPHVDYLRATATHPTKPNSETEYHEYLVEHGVEDDRDDEILHEWEAEMGTEHGQGWDGRPSRLDYEHQPEYWSVERVKDFVREGDDEPFCAWLSFNRPHEVYAPPQQFWDMYPEDELELPPSWDEPLSDKPRSQRRHREKQEEGFYSVFGDETYEGNLRRAVRGYLGCVTMVDDLVGRVLDFLEEEGLREDTIVIYCADHGDFAGEHGIIEKAPGISYDAITRIPYIWSWPGEIRAGEVCSELVETVDMVPTLVNMIDDRPVQSADGYDITGHLTGEGSAPGREYAVTEFPWSKSIRTDSTKFTLYPRGFFGEGSDEFVEFYDLEDDPWETTNLAEDAPEEHADEIAHHRRLLYEFVVTNRRPVSTLPLLREEADDPADEFTYDERTSPHTIREHLADEDSNRRYL